jgi:hypothetical protein
MKTKLLAMVLLGSSALFGGTSIQIGIGIGSPRGGRYVVQPPPPPPLVRVVPRSPGRNYVWVPGYWNWNGNRYFWVNGYWAKGRGNGWRNNPGYGYYGR